MAGIASGGVRVVRKIYCILIHRGVRRRTTKTYLTTVLSKSAVLELGRMVRGMCWRRLALRIFIPHRLGMRWCFFFTLRAIILVEIDVMPSALRKPSECSTVGLCCAAESRRVLRSRDVFASCSDAFDPYV